MRAQRFAVLAATLALTAAVVGPASAALHPGDRVTVVVYNHPELSGDRTIDASGNVSFPVAGTVSALNVEPDELARRLQERLSPYIRYAAVNVQLTAQNTSIFVAGGPTGVIAYAPGMTVASIVDDLNAPAQLESASAANTAAVVQHNTTQGVLDLENGPIDFHHVRILRDGKTLGTYDVIGLRAAGDPGPALMPNDTVALQNKPIAIDVSGDVERPGMAYLNPGEPLSEAITQVGGLNDTSTESDLWLNRDGKTQVVSMGAPEFAMPAQPGDRIVVPRATRVDVLGNVEKPGDTLLRGTPTLVGAIYYAGGPAKYANLKAVIVIHNGVRKQYNLAALQHGGTSDNPTLADGDVVMVPQGSTFEWQDVWSGLGALGFLGLRIL